MRKLIAVLPVAAVAAFALVAIGAGAAGGRGAVHSAKTTTLQLRASPSGATRFDRKKLSASHGKVTIVMTNPSSSGLTHGIAVKGNGVAKVGRKVRPGKQSILTVTLKKKGKHTFYCPVDDHRNMGMKGTLTIH